MHSNACGSDRFRRARCKACCAALLAAIAATAPAWADDLTEDPYDLRALEAREVRIGHIRLIVDDVFDTGNPREDKASFRLANALHRRTRRETIESQLLFRSGDLLSVQKLEETERILRSRGYLSAAEVRAVRIENGLIDLEVRVHDVWTLSPGIGFGRAGGENRSSIELEEANFLGLGSKLALSRTFDVDRSALELEYAHTNLFGTWWQIAARHADASDGASTALEVGLPFYSLDARRSFSMRLSRDEREQPLYDLGRETSRLRVSRTVAAFETGFSRGLRAGWTRRWLAGVRLDETELAAAEDDASAVFERRRLFYPWIGLELLEDRYRCEQNLDQIGRVEDLYLGRSLRAELGWSPGAGSTSDAAVLSLNGRWSLSPNDRDLLQLEASGAGRLEGGEPRSFRTQVVIRGYHRLTPRQLLASHLSVVALRNPDPEQQLLLGGDSGLRGYPLRFQSGERHALATLEYRFFTDWCPLRLARVGGAVFFDTGRAWSGSGGLASEAGWLSDIGFGLRLGNTRSSHGSVLHLDLAVPLNRNIPGAGSIDSLQFLVKTRTSF